MGIKKAARRLNIRRRHKALCAGERVQAKMLMDRFADHIISVCRLPQTEKHRKRGGLFLGLCLLVKLFFICIIEHHFSTNHDMICG